MRQAVMTRPGQIEFRDVPPPQLGPGDVRLSVRRIGICGSDIHVWRGKHPFTPYPVVQGHEYSATVEAVAAGVADVQPGMKATARPQVACGECDPCRRGDYNVCNALRVEGFQAPGCAQELFTVPRDRLVILPDALSYDMGALVEPTAVAAHATRRAGNLTGLDVAVLGAGTIGNLVAQAARCRGAGRVLITDRSRFRLDRAKECCIDAVCDVSREQVGAAARRIFGKPHFDIAFEAAGSEAALDDAVQHVKKSSRIVAVGVFEQRPRVDVSVLGDRELSLIGTLMYKQEDYEQAVQWIATGAVRTEPLITRHFAFEDYADAYRFIETQGDRALKIIIDVQ